MHFIAILIALFIDRVIWRGAHVRDYAWFDRCCRRLTGSGAGEWLARKSWGPLALLLPIVLPLAWLQGMFAAMDSDLLQLVLGGAVLLYCIGPRDLGTDAEAFLAARDANDQDAADAAAAHFAPDHDPAHGEPQRTLTVARGLVTGVNSRLVAPLFWFALFGAVGAAAYRGIELLRGHYDVERHPPMFARGTALLQHLADWIPARITAAAYAAAGNFDAVGHAWRNFAYAGDSPGRGSEAEELLLATGLAALDTYPDMGDNCDLLSEPPPVVEDALALVWRALTLLVLLLGGGTLVATFA